MSHRGWTRAELAAYDKRAERFGIAGRVLMENAGRGAAIRLSELGARGPVAIVCGKGNNAGDGFVIARFLHLAGLPVRVESVFPAEQLTGDAANAWLPLAPLGIPRFDANDGLPARLAPCDWIVDALLGTGAKGDPREPIAAAIRTINRAGKPILAVDLPSGLDADLGTPGDPTIRATRTVSFVARKLGFDQPSANEFTGPVDVIDIAGGPVDSPPSC